MGTIDDAQLVALARTGDMNSLGELFERYQSKIYNYAMSISRNPDDAKDVTQDAFLKVFEALPRHGEDMNFAAYLFRTTHNLAIDAAKSKARFASPDALDLAEDDRLTADPERTALLKEQQVQIRDAAFSLSDNHRAILALREIEDMSYQEIADVLGMPKNTVGVLLSRARLRFKGAFRMSSVDVEKLSQECQTMLPLLSGYIDGELTDQERTRVSEHLDDCPLCRLALEEMTEASKSYRGLIPLIPLAGIRQAIESRLGPMGSGSGGQAVGDAGQVAAGAGQPAPGDAGGAQAGAAQTPSDASALSGTTEKLPEIGAEGGVGGGGEDGGAALQASGQGLSTFAGSISRTQRIALGILLMALFVAVGVFGATVMLLPPPDAPIPPESTVQTTEPPAGEVGSLVATETTSGGVDPRAQPGTDEEEPDQPTEPEDAGDRKPAPDTDAPATPIQLSPADDAVLSDRRVTLEWRPVTDPSGVTYSLEIQVFVGGGAGYGALDTASGLGGTRYSHTLGDMTERWRVWAVDGAGNASPRSDWRNMTKTADEPEPSTEPTYPAIY